MRTLIAAFLILGSGLTSVCAQDEDGFVLVKADPPIEVHERWVEFPGKQPVVSTRELKSSFIVAASAHDVIALIRDEARVKSWQSHVKNYKIYQKQDSMVWDEYSCHDVPWPFSDQESFMEYRLSEISPDEYVIAFRSRSDPKMAPLNEDINRMELLGSWRLEKISDTQTRVTYRILSVPTSGIPRMILDPVIRNNLVATIRSLTEILEK